MKRFFFIMLSAIMLSLSAVNVYAGSLDLDKESSLNLKISYGSLNIQNMSLNISRVAGFEMNGSNIEFIITDEFRASGVDLSGKIDTERNIELSKRLLTFARANNVTWLNEITNENGEALFSDIETGLYLVAQFGDESRYEIAPFLITIPLLDESNGQYIYDVDTYPKTETEYTPPSSPPPSDPPPDEPDEPDETPTPTPPPSSTPPSDPPPDNPPEDNDPPEYNPPSYNPPEPPAPEAAASDSPIFLLDSQTPEGAPDFDPTFTMDSETPTGSLPQTGMLLWPVPVLFGFGSLSLVTGSVMVVKDKKRDDYDE